MKRSVVLATAGALLLAGAVFAWSAVRQEREDRRALAIEPVRRAVALDNRFAEAHYLLAMCLGDAKRDADALKSLSKAIELNPAFGAAREELASLDLAHGRNREAIEQLEALAALEPTRPQRLVDVGLAYARLGRPE